MPVDRLPSSWTSSPARSPIQPVWFCPLRQRDPDAVWDLYRLDPDVLYVNVGFWSSVALEPGEPDGTHNRLVERLVDDLGGRKSLYCTIFYDREHFWRLYDGTVYEVLKKTYDPDGRLLDLYDKCVGVRTTTPTTRGTDSAGGRRPGGRDRGARALRGVRRVAAPGTRRSDVASRWSRPRR